MTKPVCLLLLFLYGVLASSSTADKIVTTSKEPKTDNTVFYFLSGTAALAATATGVLLYARTTDPTSTTTFDGDIESAIPKGTFADITVSKQPAHEVAQPSPDFKSRIMENVRNAQEQILRRSPSPVGKKDLVEGVEDNIGADKQEPSKKKHKKRSKNKNKNK